HLGNDRQFLLLIYPHHRTQNLEIVIIFVGSIMNGLYIFGEATAAIADACKYKSLADARISADTPAHIIYIGSHAFANIGHFIHKRDFSSQHSISSIFGQFSTAPIHYYNRVPAAHEWL